MPPSSPSCQSVLTDRIRRLLPIFSFNDWTRRSIVVGITCQYDNDSKLLAKNVMKWISSQQFEVLNKLEQDPDLNPAKNCWDYFRYQLFSNPYKIN